MNRFEQLNQEGRVKIGVALESVYRFNFLIFLNNLSKPILFEALAEQLGWDNSTCSFQLNILLGAKLAGHTYPEGYHITPLGRDTLEFLLKEED